MGVNRNDQWMARIRKKRRGGGKKGQDFMLR